MDAARRVVVLSDGTEGLIVAWDKTPRADLLGEPREKSPLMTRDLACLMVVSDCSWLLSVLVVSLASLACFDPTHSIPRLAARLDVEEASDTQRLAMTCLRGCR